MYNVFGSFGVNAEYSAELNEIILVTAAVPVNVSPTLVTTLPLAEPDKNVIEPVNDEEPVTLSCPFIFSVPIKLLEPVVANEPVLIELPVIEAN
jgi:hypothetical protein